MPIPGANWRQHYAGTRADLGPGDRCYHGTRAALKPGDLIRPGHAANFGNLERATTYVYFAATLDAAVWGAELARGEGRGRITSSNRPDRSSTTPISPTRDFRAIPPSDRSREPLRVTGEVEEWQGHPAEVLQAMKDHLQRLVEEGVEPEDD